MYLPPINTPKEGVVLTKSFYGLDEGTKIDDRSFSAMKNMSSDALPAAVPRKPRRKIAEIANITALCLPAYTAGGLTSFTGIAGNAFYYNGKKITGEPLTAGKKSIADFGGKICIFPDKLYYDYLPDPDTGEVAETLQKLEKTCVVTGAVFRTTKNDISGAYSASISKTGANFDETFAVGDSIVISGCGTEKNNTKIVESRKDIAAADDIISVVVEAVTASRLDVRLYDKKGALAAFQNTTESGAVTIAVHIPDMNHVCVHNNRLWGTAANGESIYASRLGDCQNFYSFQGLGDDSWYSLLGTDGDFTGICSYRNAVVAFKRDCIHHVYGDSPTNFSIPKQIYGGCMDGDSITQIGGILYYLSPSGFSAYGGGEPYSIGERLRTKHTACCAGTDGIKYYASATREDGLHELLVFDTRYGVWHKEDNIPFVGFVSRDGKLYGADQQALFLFGEGEETFPWCVVSKRFTYDITQHKGVNCIYLRAEVAEGARIRVSLSHDDGPFTHCGEITGSGFSVRRIPVRFRKCDSFRLMCEGEGEAVIHDIEFISYNGGKTNER